MTSARRFIRWASPRPSSVRCRWPLWPGMGLPTCSARASARRRRGRGPRTFPWRDGGVARQTGRFRLAGPLRAVHRGVGWAGAGHPRPVTAGISIHPPSDLTADGALRRECPAIGAQARRADVSRGTRTRALRRDGRALHAAAGAAGERRDRARAGNARTLIGWPSRKAGRRRSWTRWRRICARSAARSSPASR